MLYRQHLWLGAVFITVSELFFATMGLGVKLASETLPNEMLVFMRNIIGLMFILPLLLREGFSNLKTDVPHLHLLRASSGVGAMYCFFYALAHLPLAEGMLLKMTAPIFMPLLAWAWLSEKVPPLALLAIPLGFVGVWIVLNPEGEFSHVALIGLLGGALAAVAKTTVRRLGHTEPTVRVVFYFSIVGTLISTIPMSWAWVMPQGMAWVWLLLLSLSGVIGQLLLTRGYAMAPAAQIAPFTWFAVVFGGLYGYWIWGELLTEHFVYGAVLIGLAGVLAVRKRLSP